MLPSSFFLLDFGTVVFEPIAFKWTYMFCRSLKALSQFSKVPLNARSDCPEIDRSVEHSYKVLFVPDTDT